MTKKQIIILCVIVAVAFTVVSSTLTYYFTTNSRGEIYLSGDEYERLMNYFEQDEIAELIAENYYDEVDRTALIDGTFKGMVESLGDGYSRYYDEEDFQYFDATAEGSYIGQGMLLTEDESGYVRVSRVFPDTPAYEANITAGALILSIDGRDTREIDVENTVSRLRGKDGIDVKLRIRIGDEETDVEFTRRSSELQVVFTDMLSDEIGYIDIVEFSGNSVSGFTDALESLNEEGATSIVIDLRNNPGGYISQASEIADMLLDGGQIYYTIGKDGEKFSITADSATSCSLPIVVLADETTKGAAEVFAAALKENGRAQIVGNRTYGKGVVISMLRIPSSGAGIRLVTAHYYTPTGAPINEVGVTPDQVISAEINPPDSEDSTSVQDAQISAAMELLQ